MFSTALFTLEYDGSHTSPRHLVSALCVSAQAGSYRSLMVTADWSHWPEAGLHSTRRVRTTASQPRASDCSMNYWYWFKTYGVFVVRIFVTFSENKTLTYGDQH